LPLLLLLLLLSVSAPVAALLVLCCQVPHVTNLDSVHIFKLQKVNNNNSEGGTLPSAGMAQAVCPQAVLVHTKMHARPRQAVNAFSAAAAHWQYTSSSIHIL
jgi:hypothetical protein